MISEGGRIIDGGGGKGREVSALCRSLREWSASEVSFARATKRGTGKSFKGGRGHKKCWGSFNTGA